MAELSDDPVIRGIQGRLDGHAAYIKAFEGMIVALLESSDLESSRIKDWITEACKNPTGFVYEPGDALGKAEFAIETTSQAREANQYSG